MYIIRLHNVAAVARLLHFGADPNRPSRKGNIPIATAANKGTVQIMQLLIDAGADIDAINESGASALIQASHFGQLEAVKLLLRACIAELCSTVASCVLGVKRILSILAC
jgi:ankyrin repeat protein